MHLLPVITLVTLQPSHHQALITQAVEQALQKFQQTLPTRQEVFTKTEAAEFLRLHSANAKPNPQAIDRLRREGKLESVEDAKTVRITRKALEKYLEEFKSV
ncbi:helix-turn-helix domain-containing protein [Siphonobacter curvatus]|uniref:DNA-binding protein n=1 Tax=Siphonobacter curvatus TaxID=2094562 RepID=A0A2S7IG97_9BACT|nr:helix-turn-helix domain-containing protein [Siphonobacter curvatus]PQA54447.1 hypothetical protein C5O19_22115 [Siphonobacter curvatus]